MVEQNQAAEIFRPSCGGYKILRQIGAGGNAIVKLVEKDNVKYAMKIFKPSPREKELTIHEYNIVTSMNIPAIVKYHELELDAKWLKKDGTDVDCSYLLMDHVNGLMLVDFFNKSLVEKLGGIGRDDEDLRFIYLQIVDGLNKLHSAGVAHRDIKPENIMINVDFTIKIIDLGYGIELKGRGGKGFNTT